jgi:hypothetical protein
VDTASFKAYATVSGSCPNLSSNEQLEPVYRLYNSATNDHMLTVDTAEVNFWTVQQKTSWSYEGVAFCAYPGRTNSSVIPIYRLDRFDAREHLVTGDSNELSVLTASGGWYQEVNGRAGVVFFALP